MQIVSDVAQSPTTAKAVPVIAAGLGWAVASEWVSLVAGLLTFLAGLAFSLTMLWINIKQHRIKMKIYEKDLEERDFRIGRKDRRDD